MCGKSQSTTSSSAPNPQAMAAYQGLLDRAGGVANLPFVPYGGEFVAPINAQQNLAGSNINANAGFAQPYIQQAAGYATQAAQPITGSDIQKYYDPFTQGVINATQADFENANQQQLNYVRGNAASQGALGGDREAIAEATTAGQQAKAEAPVIAGLQTQGFNTALSTALQEQQNLGQSAYSLGNLGVAGQNAALTGANAQLGFGTLGQSTQQALDQALYGQFQAQQGFPFQEAQWLAGIDTGVGSQMGGTSQTTGPAPNQTASYAGLALAALAMSDRRVKEGVRKIGETKDGQPIYRYRYKGSPQWHIGLMAQDVEKRHPHAVAGLGGVKFVDLKAATEDAAHRAYGGKVRGFALGGMPYAGGDSYIPTIGITGGQGAPKAPGLPNQPQVDPLKQASSVMDFEKKLQGLGKSSSIFGWGDPSTADAQAAGLDSGLGADEVGIGIDGAYRRGGRIRGFAYGGYADGGDTLDDDFDSRFNASSDYASRNAIPVNQDSGYDPQLDDLGRMSALNGLRRPGEPESTRQSLGLGSIVETESPGFRADNPARNAGPVYPRIPYNDGSEGDDDYVNPRVVNGQPQNLTGPIIPPGGFGQAPGLSPPSDVADTRTAGLGSPPVSDSGGGTSGRALSFAPTGGSGARDSGESGQGGLFGLHNPLNLSPDMRKALLAAGFGMMASRSPQLGPAIGEGGLAGLSAYTGSQKQELEAEKTHASIEDARKKLEMHADEASKRLALDTKKVQQQEEHMQILRDQAEKGRIPPGYERVEGGLRALPGGPADPEAAGKLAGAKKGATEPSFDDNTLTKMADQYLAGDKGVLVNLGRGAQGATDLKALRKRIVERMDEAGITPQQQAVKMQEFVGLGAGERALGTRTAQIEMAANEARNMMKPALEAAAAVPRTNFVPVNKLIEAWQTGGVSDPAQARFAAANFSLVNTYVRAIAPTGVPPESARNHALQMLSGAMSHESYKAVIDQMNIEMEAALKSPGQVMDKFRDLHGGASPGAAGPTASVGRSAVDQQALEWANANPNDPRAVEIKKRLGVQ